MRVGIKRLSKTAKMPKYATEGAAGFDLCVDIEEDMIIKPHETRMMSTGLAFEIPSGCFGAIYARSGLSTKEGLRPATCVSVIDSDYRGPVGVPMHNDTDYERIIRPHERVAQMIITEIPKVTLIEVQEVSETERGTGGFGSTGR